MSGRGGPGARLDEASLGSLVELAHDAILVRRLDGRIVFWNAGAERLYGWSEAEALGRSSHELLATRFPLPFEAIEQELVGGGGWEGELVHRTKTGEEVVVESRWAARRDARGELVAVLEVDRDITARTAAERALAAEAARFRAIFESSLEAILLTAPDGRILAANPAAEAMFGRSEAEIVAGGRELLVDTSDPRLAAAVQARAEHGSFRGDIRALRSDGTPFEIEFSSVVFRDAAGEPRTSMIVRDLTERLRALQAAHESEERFRTLADAAFEAVFVHDRGRILLANRAASALFGYGEDELTGMHVRDFASSSEGDRVEAIFESGSEQPYEATAVTAAGAELAVEISARATTFQGRPARVVAIRDVTERQRARKALEEQNERLRELDALKNEFVALVSHELRTPLTSIMAHLDVLADGEAGELNERQRRYLEVTTRNARRLRRLVDDLLLAARADAGQFSLDYGAVALVPLAEEIVEELGPAAAGAGVELGLAAPAAPVVEGDRDRIAQLLGNLAWNALDATAEGGAVTISVGADEREATLTVVDTGVGIPPEDVPHLFDRFHRARGTRSPGVGLGLAIVKEIADAHRGTVEIASEPGRGTSVTVRLPVQR